MLKRYKEKKNNAKNVLKKRTNLIDLFSITCI